MNKIDFKDIVSHYESDLIDNLQTLISVNSVYDETTIDTLNPFGTGVTKCLKLVEDMARKDGFDVKNYNNMVVEISCGSGEKNITILSHADIVPAGTTGWENDPFTLVEKDGVLLGRGVADDKGPLLSAYYALKALRDNNLLGNYKVRFLVGGNEESGSRCMEYYFKDLKMPQPTFGFSPDAEFPLIFAEKGITNFLASTECDLSDVISIEGGVASNSVIEKCVVKTTPASSFDSYCISHNYDVLISSKEECKEIVFIGKSAHGATPEEGINAGMIALKALSDFYNNDTLKQTISLYDDIYGKGCNAYEESEDMGKNSLNVGLISYKNGLLTLTINFRFVDTVTDEIILKRIKNASYPFNIEVLTSYPVLYYPKDSTLVSTLLKAYQDETLDYDSLPKAIGGGTYAKEAENVIAFGMEFPGWNSMMHSPGEKVKKEDLFKSMSIYARAIYELGRKIDEN